MLLVFSLQLHVLNIQFEKIYNGFVSGQTETLREFKLLEGHVLWWQELKGWQFPAVCGSHGMHAVLQFK